MDKDYSDWTAFSLENKHKDLKAMINNKQAIDVHVTYPAFPYTKEKGSQRVVLPVNSKSIKKAAVEEMEKELKLVKKHWDEKVKEEWMNWAKGNRSE